MWSRMRNKRDKEIYWSQIILRKVQYFNVDR